VSARVTFPPRSLVHFILTMNGPSVYSVTVSPLAVPDALTIPGVPIRRLLDRNELADWPFNVAASLAWFAFVASSAFVA
jgi:hypothetical protein